MQLDHYRLIGEAEDKKEAYRALVADVPYEEEGVLYSEMFFLSLCSSQFEPLRMLESGRGRGQSTELFAKLFADMPILSVELEGSSAAAEIAKKRLAPYPNVELLAGDAHELLHTKSKAGDIVLIDGPQGFKGLKLLLNLLATRKFELAFIHDIAVGTPERAFLEKHLPSTVYSDDPQFAEVCHDLDDRAAAQIPAGHDFETTRGRFGYGFGMACLPYDARFNYGGLARKAGFAALKQSLARKLGGK
jgi:hypothetical protein